MQQQTKKNKNTIKSVLVVLVAIIAIIIVIVFVFTNPLEDDKKATDKVMLNKDGEASYLNLSVPSSNQKEDSLSILDKLEQIKMDSLNKSKLNSTGLEEYKEIETKRNNTNDLNNLKPYRQTTSQYNSKITLSTNKDHTKVRKHDEVIKKQTPASSNQEPSFEPWDSKPTEKRNTTEKSPINETASGFFKSKNRKLNSQTKSNINNVLIFASVHTNQTIRNNERVKFITTKDFYYNNKKYEANTVVYGFAKIQPNRLIIDINKINQTDIKLEVYDSEDSGKGIYILTPNLNASLQKELKKEGIVQADDLGNLGSIPFSKTILSVFEKKVKEEKVELLNNYKVIIKIADEK